MKTVVHLQDIFILNPVWGGDFETNLSRVFKHYLKLMLPYEMLLRPGNRENVPRMERLRLTRVYTKGQFSDAMAQ